MMFVPRSTRFTASRIVVSYAILAGLWIALSDELLAWLVHSPDWLVRLSTLKGWMFVVATSALLYYQLIRTLHRQVQQQEKEKIAQSRLDLYGHVFEESRDGMLITDANNRIIMINRAFSDLTGYRPEDLLGQNPNLLSSGRQGRDFYLELWTALTDVGTWQGQIWNRRKDGEVILIWMAINVVRDEHGLVSHYFAICTDFSERHAQEELQRLQRFDALTNLPNKLLLEDRANEAIDHARQYSRHVALLCLNLDRFHYVNESLGHAVGDELLRIVARRLELVAGESCTVSRLSGDNFVILQPDRPNALEAVTLSESLLAAAREIIPLRGSTISLTARIGIALFPQDGDQFGTLLRNADSALLRAREEGLGSYCFYTNDLNERANHILAMSADLREALEKNLFELHYQPQLSAVDGHVCGVEALIRFRHPVRGLISPADFIPIAEDTGLIVPIGAWALREACAQLRRWQDLGLELTMAVNLSPLQLRDPRMGRVVADAIEESGIPPHHLELEFTESVLMRNVDAARGFMQELKALGVRLAIDDFGTGYSSLNYLRQFPIDRIKIDQSFVRQMLDDQRNIAIVKAMVSLSCALGMKTTAEGVETAEQAQCLREMGCDELQGYHFSRPEIAEKIQAFLSLGQVAASS